MDRLRKLLGIILILGIVFFIICDEKGYKIELDGNHIVFNEIEKKPKTVETPFSYNTVYKNSNLININYIFRNPEVLRRVDVEDSKYLAKINKKKAAEKKLNKEEKVYTGPRIVDVNDKSTISSVFQIIESENNGENIEDEIQTIKPEILYKKSHRIKIYSGFENPINMRRGISINENPMDDGFSSLDNNIEIVYTDDINQKDVDSSEVGIDNINPVNSEGFEIQNDNTYEIEKYEHKIHDVNIRNSAKIENNNQYIDLQGDHPNYSESDYTGNIEILEIEPLIKIERYQLKKHLLTLRKGVIIEHNFVVENGQNIELGISDSMFQDLLENEEIDFNTLESENDEFLQKVFEKTRDVEVMNLIVETYLNEYQFIKAKRFIDNLSGDYITKLKPTLNLRVAFNSFSLGSKIIYTNLESLIQSYSLKNEISDEDKNRYLGVLALMNQNYNKFFEIGKNFGSEKNKTFVLKIQGYKNQIAKQMGMPDYYFDTLVSLELFNQGLFQPAKVLALYSLQKDPNYILPYQVLAYANFLTNSRDTSVEYLKKLIDLDPNNAEKYRFLMGVAFYRNEKYEQSVVMLSMIKDEKLRLDSQRYLINNYLKLDQKNKLILSWNKMLGSENLVSSDFYTYFYEAFFHPYSEGKEFQLYAYDTELANKMLRVCSILMQDEEKAVCTYGTIGRNIALGQFEGIEQYLLNLVTEYPQGYLYQALGDYYIQHKDIEKAKIYLLKAVSLTQKTSQKNQVKKLLQDTM